MNFVLLIAFIFVMKPYLSVLLLYIFFGSCKVLKYESISEIQVILKKYLAFIEKYHIWKYFQFRY